MNPRALAIDLFNKLNAGQAASVAKSARVAFKKHPKVAQFAQLTGAALAELGKHGEAAVFYSKAYRLAPDDGDLRRHFAFALVNSGKAGTAQKLVGKWLDDAPDDPDLTYVMAFVLSAQKKFAEAEAAATQTLSQTPDRIDALNLRGFARIELRKHTAALADFERSEQLQPGQVDTTLNIAVLLQRTYQFDAAIEKLHAAVNAHPDDIALRRILAIQLNEVGRFDDAIRHNRVLAQLDPFHSEALVDLAQQEDTDALTALDRQISKAMEHFQPRVEAQVNLALARAIVCERGGDQKQARQFLKASNALRAKLQPYDGKAAERRLRRTRDMFPTDHTLRSGGETQQPTPIFVVGQPRSGTTLSERMLSAHPLVDGLGELNLVEVPLTPVWDGGNFDAGALAADFRAAMPPRDNVAPWFVDKTPENFMSIGFLLEAFPKARIVHIERDPREVAASMWKQHLVGALTFYTSDMRWMAHSANLYRQYMIHWKTLFGSAIRTFHYRDIVTDPEGQSQQMAAFCGLDWVPEMAAPENSAGSIRTASVLQARQTINTTSLGKWTRLGADIQPFIDGLDPLLWPEIDLSEAPD